jgi:hypothetical protein
VAYLHDSQASKFFGQIAIGVNSIPLREGENTSTLKISRIEKAERQLSSPESKDTRADVFCCHAIIFLACAYAFYFCANGKLAPSCG